jgi:hypothetical protein
MALGIIDIWDHKTFDEELLAILNGHADLVRDYMTTENDIFLSHDLGRGPKRSVLRPNNDYASAFLAFTEAIGEQMQLRTIRAWHYTRLTELELEIMLRDGIHLSTPETLQTRLNALVASGDLSAEISDKLFAASPFHSDQFEIRSNKFWMVSNPILTDDSGVTPLMSHWGGEVASMWTEDPVLLDPLAVIGTPCVLEVAAPLKLTKHAYRAAGAVLATFGRSLGCIPDGNGLDLYVTAPLEPNAILRVHRAADTTFEIIGRGYPDGFVDVRLDHWKQLTGEDE